jgi:hypothetical protein
MEYRYRIELDATEHYLIAIAANCKNMMTTSTIDIRKYENYLLHDKGAADDKTFFNF